MTTTGCNYSRIEQKPHSFNVTVLDHLILVHLFLFFLLGLEINDPNMKYCLNSIFAYCGGIGCTFCMIQIRVWKRMF